MFVEDISGAKDQLSHGSDHIMAFFSFFDIITLMTDSSRLACVGHLF